MRQDIDILVELSTQCCSDSSPRVSVRDLLAKDRRAYEVYLKEVERAMSISDCLE